MKTHFITRFAPSPTGALHLGHAYAARVAHDFAARSGGKMILRIDDIDHTRCKEKFIPPILANLDWLGLKWHNSKCNQSYSDSVKNQNAARQSDRLAQYQAALKSLENKGLIYPCYLSRRELNELLSAPHTLPSPHQITQVEAGSNFQKVAINTDQLLSPRDKIFRRANGIGPAWRLRMGAALKIAKEMTSNSLSWFDHITGHHVANPEQFGDFVVARADIGVSYHLSVVVDDALDGVNLVTRGNDLAEFTHLHRLLQALLHLPVPDYCHHALVLDANGKRLAKRDPTYNLDDIRKQFTDPAIIFAKMPPIPSLKPK